MDYQTAHRRLERHQLSVIAGLILAFIIAAVLMFVHPTASLAVFAIGFAGALAALIVGAWLRHVEQVIARKELAHQACPKCGAAVAHEKERPEDWHCSECGADFSARGAELA